LAVSAIAILGIFVADANFRASRQPRMGETLLGSSFALGPGGKGSNQAVAAARLGGDVTFISKIGQDPFGDMAMALWDEAGVKPAVERDADSYTGAASIFLEEATGDNAIIVCPGASATLSPADIEAAGDDIRAASVFVTQLEVPLPTVRRALEIARARRFGHGRECLRRAKLGYFFRVQQRALGAEGNDRRADAFLQQLVAGVSRLADDSDRHAGQVSGLGFIRREIIAKRKGRRVQLRRRCRI